MPIADATLRFDHTVGDGPRRRPARVLYVAHLRNLIEPDAKRPAYFHTVRGHGYVLRAPRSLRAAGGAR